MKGTTKTHKNLEVWKKAMDIVENIYSITAGFPREEQYGLVSQIRRSAVSIPSNIAEGAARNSEKEFIHFLFISMVSLSEMETQLLIAKRLGMLNNDDILDKIVSIRKMTSGLIWHLKGRKRVTT